MTAVAAGTAVAAIAAVTVVAAVSGVAAACQVFQRRACVSTLACRRHGSTSCRRCNRQGETPYMARVE